MMNDRKTPTTQATPIDGLAAAVKQLEDAAKADKPRPSSQWSVTARAVRVTLDPELCRMAFELGSGGVLTVSVNADLMVGMLGQIIAQAKIENGGAA